MFRFNEIFERQTIFQLRKVKIIFGKHSNKSDVIVSATSKITNDLKIKIFGAEKKFSIILSLIYKSNALAIFQ